jgi:hypothetical protein
MGAAELHIGFANAGAEPIRASINAAASPLTMRVNMFASVDLVPTE